jgi:hypothetical protein
MIKIDKDKMFNLNKSDKFNMPKILTVKIKFSKISQQWTKFQKWLKP